MKMKNFKNHRRAVSPVLSVLLMIAVAVAASLVTYAWVMGYLGNTTGKVGRAIQVQSMAKVGTDLNVYVQNVGEGPVTLDSLYVNGIKMSPVSGTGTIDKGETQTLSTEFQSPAWDAPSTVKVKVVCSDGTFIEASGTVPGS
jgi:flagellin-like protein